MPELPEVETIRRGLSKYIVRKKIREIQVLCEKSFIGDLTEVEGREILEIQRRGKALLIRLGGGKVLMVHLRMTGQMIYQGKERFAGGHPNENFLEELPNKQTRVIFSLTEGKLFFNDQRKFGFIKVLGEDEVEEEAFIRKLAKEPWEMTEEEFFEVLQRKKVAIKAALLDQSVVAGLGNIYTDEALYLSGIHPKTLTDSLNQAQAGILLKNARGVMEKSIELGGSTIRNYLNADGTRGNYLDKFAKVYGREGEKCEKCGGKIKKIRVAGRGTYFCEECQR